MKFIKLSVFTLTMGLFLASCDGSGAANAPATTDTATLAPAAPAAETQKPLDTLTAPAAKPADAPATDATKADEKKK